MIRGADVSSFQGAPGSWQPKAGTIDWAAVKFTELSAAGAYRNPTAAADWQFLGQQGKGRIAYAFGHPSVLPSHTVALLADMLHPLGLEDGDGIALDLETTDGLAAVTVAAWARATTAAMREVFGRPCIIYSDLAFFQAGNCAGCEACPLWIADISRPAGQPRVPAPWKTWALHQFSWTPLDRDVANFATLPAFRAAIGKPAPPAPAATPEDPMLLNRGAGAVTPLAIPGNCTSVRFYAAAPADLTWALAGGKPQGLKLTAASSQVVSLPSGHHALAVTRVDAGTGDVSAVGQP